MIDVANELVCITSWRTEPVTGYRFFMLLASSWVNDFYVRDRNFIVPCTLANVANAQ